MKGGKAAREKGARLEREIVAILTSSGHDAKRVPLSGSVQGFKGDVHALIAAQPLVIEAKSRAQGFQPLYDWLETAGALVVKQDRGEPLAVLPLRRLMRLINGAITAGKRAAEQGSGGVMALASKQPPNQEAIQSSISHSDSYPTAIEQLTDQSE